MGTIVSLLIFVAGILAYGVYHERTHGSLSVTLYDSAQQPAQPKIFKDEVAFFDASGKFLARAKSDVKYGVLRPIHPVVGDCVGEEQSATTAADGRNKWQACFEQQSTWLVSWVRQARFAEVKLESCPAQRMPIKISASGDNWWLWWVPLPHIGGKPYGYFSAMIKVDRAKCAVIAD